MPKLIERPTEDETGAEAPVSSLPPEVLQFMQDLTRQVASLASEVATIKEARPAPFRPMNPLQQAGAVEKLLIPRDGKPHMDHGHGKQMPQGDSFVLTPEIMASAAKRFRVGSRVRLNSDANRGQVRTEIVMKTFERRDHRGEPFSDVKEVKEFIPITWGELVAGLPQLHCPSRPIDDYRCPGVLTPGGICPACGWAATVARVEFLNSRGQWVYKVCFPGISSGAREQAFEDWELEPA